MLTRPAAAVPVPPACPQVATLEGDDAKNGELYVKVAEKGAEKVRAGGGGGAAGGGAAGAAGCIKCLKCRPGALLAVLPPPPAHPAAPAQGSAWLSKERARVEKMLGTGHVSAAKSEEMSKKVSVLGAFLDEPASS